MLVLYVDDDCLVLESAEREEILSHAQLLFRQSGDCIEEARGKRLVKIQLTFFREGLTNGSTDFTLKGTRGGDAQLTCFDPPSED